MWIYYNQFGNLTTKIPHGEVIRQGATFNFYIAVDKEYFKEDIVKSTNRNFLSFTLQEIVDWINTKILATLKINDLSAIDVLRAEKKKFTKVKNSEITFDFVNNQEYIVFNYTGNHSLLTKPGNYEAVFQLKNKDTNETKPLGLIQFHCEKTYGQNIPNEQITPDQYNYLLSTIGDKVSYADYDIYDVGTFSSIKDIAHAILAHKNIKDGSFFYKAKLEDTNMGFSKDAIAIAGYDNNHDSSSFRTIILCDNQVSVYGGLDNEHIEMLTIPQLFTRKLKVVESIEVPTPTSDTNAVNKKYVDVQKEEVKKTIPTKNSQLENDSNYATEKFVKENVFDGVYDSLKNKPNIVNNISDGSSTDLATTGAIKNYVSNEIANIDISKSKLIEIIGIATTNTTGLMSVEDKQKLETIANLLSNEEDENNVVDKINELIKIFKNYPETSNLIDLLSNKADKTDLKNIPYEDIIDKPAEAIFVVRDKVSEDTTQTAQEIEINGIKWAVGVSNIKLYQHCIKCVLIVESGAAPLEKRFLSTSSTPVTAQEFVTALNNKINSVPYSSITLNFDNGTVIHDNNYGIHHINIYTEGMYEDAGNTNFVKYYTKDIYVGEFKVGEVEIGSISSESFTDEVKEVSAEIYL